MIHIRFRPDHQHPSGGLFTGQQRKFVLASVLCFATDEDARKFQSGFGAQLCSLEQAQASLMQAVALTGDG